MKLTTNEPGATDSFGAFVAINGSWALVGATTDNHAGTHSGSAFLCQEDAQGVWKQVAKLVASDAAGGDIFGSVGISGNTAVVGALFDGDRGIDAGSAYIYAVPEPKSWVLLMGVAVIGMCHYGRECSRRAAR